MRFDMTCPECFHAVLLTLSSHETWVPHSDIEKDILTRYIFLPYERAHFRPTSFRERPSKRISSFSMWIYIDIYIDVRIYWANSFINDAFMRGECSVHRHRPPMLHLTRLHLIPISIYWHSTMESRFLERFSMSDCNLIVKTMSSLRNALSISI